MVELIGYFASKKGVAQRETSICYLSLTDAVTNAVVSDSIQLPNPTAA